jgi:hypothetical protein
MSFYSDQAAQFEATAEAIQTRLENDGAAMDLATYNTLKSQHDTLLDQANDMTLDDIQVTLAAMTVDQAQLATATKSLTTAVANVQRLDQIVAIASSAVSLAAAILSANPVTILTAITGAQTTITAAFPKPPAPAAPADGLAIAAAADPAP